MGSITQTIFIFSLFFILFYVLPLYGGDDNTIVTPLEQLQTDNYFVRDMKKKALSDDYYLQSMALYLIEKTIQNNAYVPVKNEILCILYHLCNHKDPLTDEKSCTRIRKKAINLIGQLGEKTRETEFAGKPWNVLLSLLNKDEIDIVSCTIFTLGNVGCNDRGKTIKTIALTVDKWLLLTRDNTFALAVITSIEKIALHNNGIYEPEVYTTLIKIIQSNDDTLIIEKALEVMNKLSTYK